MAHVLILGMTESGKTTLARNLAHYYKRQQVGVIVLDPLCDPRWPADFITADEEEFLDVFWRSRSVAAFMDEGAESVGRYNLAMNATATRGRHWGHSCHYIAQKATSLAPIVREQCSHVFLYKSSLAQGKILAEDFVDDRLLECVSLRRYEYIHAEKYGDVKRVAPPSQTGDRNVADSSSHRSRNDDSRNTARSEDEGRPALAARSTGVADSAEPGDSIE